MCLELNLMQNLEKSKQDLFKTNIMMIIISFVFEVLIFFILHASNFQFTFLSNTISLSLKMFLYGPSCRPGALKGLFVYDVSGKEPEIQQLPVEAQFDPEMPV